MTKESLRSVIEVIEHEVEGIIQLDGVATDSPLYAYLETAIFSLLSAAARCSTDFNE